MDIFNEILWPQFIKIEKYSKLQLHEQVTAYNQYLYDLSIARQNWINYQNKGLIERYLAQEEQYMTEGYLDYYLVLQEDGSKIIIT
jgi:hypothetical protein